MIQEFTAGTTEAENIPPNTRSIYKNPRESIQPKKVSLRIGKNLVIKNGEVSRSYSESRTKKYMKGEEILLSIDLGLGNGESDIWTCDLTAEYIRINADYRS